MRPYAPRPTNKSDEQQKRTRPFPKRLLSDAQTLSNPTFRPRFILCTRGWPNVCTQNWTRELRHSETLTLIQVHAQHDNPDSNCKERRWSNANAMHSLLCVHSCSTMRAAYCVTLHRTKVDAFLACIEPCISKDKVTPCAKSCAARVEMTSLTTSPPLLCPTISLPLHTRSQSMEESCLLCYSSYSYRKIALGYAPSPIETMPNVTHTSSPEPRNVVVRSDVLELPPRSLSGFEPL